MKLQSKIKAAVAAVALAFAGTAMADINTGILSAPGAQQGNGELFLSVWNTTLAQSYTRDLGINLSNFLPATATGPNNVAAGNGVDYAFGAAPTGTASVLTPGYRLVFGNDSTASAAVLTTLLGTAGTIWSVVANDGFGAGRRLLFTSNAAAPVVNDTQLNTANANIATHLGQVNLLQAGPADPTANFSSDATDPSFAYSGNSAFSTNLSTFGFNTTAGIGTALNFWSAATGAGASQYTDATWLMDSSGTLSYDVQVAAIPEPGTWAMLVAGLLMVGGIARRRTSV